MGFLAPAMPWIIKGGAALAGGLLGRKAEKSAMARSPEEQAALAGAQSSATNMTTQGNALLNRAAPMMGQAGDYWSNLLGGNRAAMSQAVAAPRAALTDVYRGAESNLERSGVRGAQRDVALSELSRDRASRIAQLTTGVQPQAANSLATMGGTLLGSGSSLLGGGADAWTNLLSGGFDNRKYARGEGEKAGKGWGGIIFDILSGTLGKIGKGGGGGGSTTPSPWPNDSPW